MRRIKKHNGFTMIEVILFIVVSALLMSTILLGADTALRSMPTVHQQWVAMQAARRCMEWFVDQRRLNGYASLTCPSTPSAGICTTSGFSVATNIACTTWNSDANYKTITVTVSGPADASLTTQIGDY